MLTLWLQSFFLLPFTEHGVNFVQTFTWRGLYFFMFTVWHEFCSLVLFLGWELKLSPYSQYRVRRTSRFYFRSYVLNLVKINISFFFQRLAVHGPIYWPPVSSEYYQFGRFISQACQNSWIERADLSAKRA